MKKKVIGVLALQGDFEAHQGMLDRIGAPNIQVRIAEELKIISGLIIPGGESTTLIRLMQAFNLTDPIRQFVVKGGAVYGTCAGAILIAAEVVNSSQFSFGFIDIGISRNSYGRQVDSFEKEIDMPVISPKPFHAVFIRAPKIVRTGPKVEILAGLDDAVIAARQDNILVTTFHPELTDNPAVHEYFVSQCVNDLSERQP